MTTLSLSKFASRLSGVGKRPILTINIHSHGIRFLAASRQKILGWGDRDIEAGTVKDGLIVHPELVGEAIGEIMEKLSLPDNTRVVSTVSGVRSLPRLIRIPKIERKLLKDAFQFESERQMPLPLNELVIAQKQLTDSDTGHVFYAVGISHDFVEAHIKSLNFARLKSYELDIKPIALARAVNQPRALILDLEPGYTEIVLVMDGTPILMRTIIMGGQYMPFEERVKQVAVEVTRTVEYYNSTSLDRPLGQEEPVFLTGKLAYSNSLVELLKSSIINPIEGVQPVIEYPNQFPASEYAVNLGLLKKRPIGEKKKSVFPAMDVEIIPPGYNMLSSPMKGLLLGLLAVLIMVLLAPMAKFDRDRNVEAAALSQELEELTQSLDNVREISKAVRETNAEISQLKEETSRILGAGNSFAAGLESVFADVPPEITLASVSITRNVIGIDGFASQRSSVIQYAASIEAQEGFSNVQIAALTSSEGASGETLIKFSIAVLR